MDLLLPLWLPILLSAAAIWVLSLVVWMALPHHKRDFIAIAHPPGEDGLMEYIRSSGIKPGNYLFPDFRDRASMETAKTQKALQEGPVGHLSIWPTPLTMGSKLIATFFVHLVVSILIAYLARIALPGPAPFAKVFQIAATAGILAYCFSFIPSALWWGSYKRTIVANVIDGVLFGLVIGAIFAWRWPHA